MKNAILLIAGILVTVVFLVCPTQIFEAAYFSNEFSNEMYNNNLYIIAAIITSAVAWGCALLFYYAINSVRFSRWYHWLIMLVIAAVVAPLGCYLYNASVFKSLGYDFLSEQSTFCLADAIFTAILYIIASFSMRWWSSNCRHTPIPE